MSRQNAAGGGEFMARIIDGDNKNLIGANLRQE